MFLSMFLNMLLNIKSGWGMSNNSSKVIKISAFD